MHRVSAMHFVCVKCKLKEAYLMDRSKKKQGFSTFLRGCNPVLS